MATLIHLVRSVVNWHANMCWRFILWTVNLTTLPIRALGALQREKMLARLLQEMQNEVENMAWNNRKLEANMQISIKEHQLMESMLGELGEDLDKSIMKIQLLETEVQNLKDENLRLREVQYKSISDRTSKINSRENQMASTHDNLPSYDSISIPNKTKTKTKTISLQEDVYTPLIFSSQEETDETRDLIREAAFSRTLFSTMLSLLVGVIIWTAEQPCLPLVMALFTVVGLSLKGVVQFFSTMKNRPASDAVALLSFNWFILGAVTCPALPQLASLLSPLGLSLLEKMVGWVG